jgi:hypothetical protein
VPIEELKEGNDRGQHRWVPCERAEVTMCISGDVQAWFDMSLTWLTSTSPHAKQKVNLPLAPSFSHESPGQSGLCQLGPPSVGQIWSEGRGGELSWPGIAQEPKTEFPLLGKREMNRYVRDGKDKSWV